MLENVSVHDWTEIGAAIFACGGFYQMMKALKTDVSAIKTDLLRLNQVIMDLALSRQQQNNFELATLERFKRLEETLRDVQHGKNLIRD